MRFVRLRIIKTKSKSTPHVNMKSITSILAALAIGTTLSIAADEKPAGAKPEAGKPAEKAAPGAEKPKHEPGEIFKKLDANNDGKVTLEEFKASPMGKKDPAKAEEMFKKKDKNNDGSLSLEEFSAHGEKKAK